MGQAEVLGVLEDLGGRATAREIHARMARRGHLVSRTSVQPILRRLERHREVAVCEVRALPSGGREIVWSVR